MLLTVILSAITAVIAEFIYLKVKHDRKTAALIFTLVFAVVISSVLFFKTELIPYIKIFTVIMLLNMCSINDVIRHESDNVFPVLIIICSLFFPQNLIYMLISFGIILLFFVIYIIMFKNTIGGGDIKIICALTFFFGLSTTLSAMIIACILGIIYAFVSKFAAKLPDFSKHFAFLPFVEAGYIAALLLQLY